MIPALVLTAGLATRLRPLSRLRAKAALPVAGEPLVRRILQQLAVSGVTEAVLNLHHLPHTITGIVGNGEDIGVRVRYSWEDPVLGSAGGPRHALGLLGRSPFLIVNGDTLRDVDVSTLMAAHQASGALVTWAVIPNTEPDKYSGVSVREGVITGFIPRGANEESFHFVGLQVAEAETFASLPDGVPAEFRQVMAANAGRIRAHVLPSADFFDIGTPADYLQTSLVLARREGRSTHGANARIASSATVVDSVLWDDVTIEADALVRECIVCEGTVVPADTAWHGVSIRQAAGDLDPGEKRIGDLAVAALSP
jgi:NDP-sugar pyrophosphorylase family protein